MLFSTVQTEIIPGNPEETYTDEFLHAFSQKLIQQFLFGLFREFFLKFINKFTDVYSFDFLDIPAALFQNFV